MNIYKDDESLEVDMKWGKVKTEPCDTVFTVRAGQSWVEHASLPESMSSSCLPLDSLPPGGDRDCWAVTHEIVNSLNVKRMTVSLVHSVPLLMSCVEVCVDSQLAVVAHTVGPDTVGQMKELGLDTMFQGVPWRAIIVKDSQGDFAVYVAGWREVRRGRRGFPGNPGHFCMVSYNLRTGRRHTMAIHLSENQIVELPGVKVDWQSGQILVRKGSRHD